MNTAITAFMKTKGTSKLSSCTEAIMTKRREDSIRRLATIQNGKHPAYQNGKTLKEGN